MTNNIKLVTNEIKKYLNDTNEEYIDFDGEKFVLSRGSTQVMLSASQMSENQIVIDCTAHVVSGAKVDSELMSFLLRQNAELHFGSFGILFDGTIIFSDSIFANDISKQVLSSTINAVASVADHFDDIIVEKAGGSRAIDNLEN